MTDIKLPPLPPLHIVPSVEPVDYPEVAQAFMDYARAAIEADRLKKEDYINDDRDMLRAEIVALKGTIADLEAECEELRKDAERYRWLRDAKINTLPYDNHGMGPEFPYDDDLDAAIDAALAQEQENKA